MLYVITSEDYSFFQKEKDAIQKEKNLAAEYVIDDVLNLGTVVDQFGQESFFETPKHLIVFKYIFEEADEEYFTQVVSLLNRYGHAVIVYEYTLSKELKSFVTNQGALHREYKKPAAKESTISPFGFTDLFIKRDKKNAWIMLSQMAEEGATMGQIGAALHWALKTLFLTKTGKEADNPDIKPYTWNKMKRETSKWTEGEIRQTLRELLFISGAEQFDEEAFRMRLEQMVFAL